MRDARRFEQEQRAQVRLTEMGYPRPAVSVALIETRNQVEPAAELLPDQVPWVERAIQAIEQQPAARATQGVSRNRSSSARLAEAMFGAGHVAREQAPRRRGNRRGQR